MNIKCPFKYIDYIGIEEIPIEVCSFKSNEEFDSFDENYCFFKKEEYCPVYKLQQQNRQSKEEKMKFRKWLEDIIKSYEDDCNNLDDDEIGRLFAYKNTLNKLLKK